MIIVSKNNTSCSVNFSNKEVKFNVEQKAEVSKELGKEIIESFPNMFWEEGKKPVKKVVDEDKETDNLEVKGLKTEIVRLNGIIVAKTKEIAVAKDAEKAWRDAAQELQDKLDGKIPTEATPIVDSNEEGEENGSSEFIVPEEHKDLYDGMRVKNFPSLKKWVKENFNKTNEDLEGISDRDNLIKFVFENCNLDG